MKKRRTIVLIIFVLGLLMGCRMLWDPGWELAWDLGNRAGLERDVRELLGDENVASDLNCHMIGATRNGRCDGELSLSAVEAVTTRLNLSKVQNTDSGDFEYESWLYAGGYSPKTNFDGIQIYRSKGHPSEFRLKDGGAFVYLLLFYEPSTGKAHIQVCYAYG